MREVSSKLFKQRSHGCGELGVRRTPFFIRIVTAVILAIAYPSFGYALVVVCFAAAIVIPRCTIVQLASTCSWCKGRSGGGSGSRARTPCFIRTIIAVSFVVAYKIFGYAHIGIVYFALALAFRGTAPVQLAPARRCQGSCSSGGGGSSGPGWTLA